MGVVDITRILQMRTNRRMVTNYGNLGANGEKEINKGIISEFDFVCLLRIQRIKTDLTELKLSNKLECKMNKFVEYYRIL